MRATDFYLGLLASIIASGLLVSLTNYALGDSADWSAGIASMIFFTLFSLIIFLVGQQSLKSENPYSYFRLIFINIIGKIFLAFAFVVIYYKLATPESKNFILPFLVVYLVFMVFETYFMLQQNKAAQQNQKK